MCPCGGLLEPCPCSGDCCPDCGCTTEAIWGSDDDWDDLDDDYQRCTGCADWVHALSPDGLCDGCVIYGPPRRVVTLRPLARYL